MKSNENEITTHLIGSFTVPFTMTIKTIVISNQDCFDGKWNALIIFSDCKLLIVEQLFHLTLSSTHDGSLKVCAVVT